jgi:hypothetical protein
MSDFPFIGQEPLTPEPRGNPPSAFPPTHEDCKPQESLDLAGAILGGKTRTGSRDQLGFHTWSCSTGKGPCSTSSSCGAAAPAAAAIFCCAAADAIGPTRSDRSQIVSLSLCARVRSEMRRRGDLFYRNPIVVLCGPCFSPSDVQGPVRLRVGPRHQWDKRASLLSVPISPHCRSLASQLGSQEAAAAVAAAKMFLTRYAIRPSQPGFDP